MSIGTGEGPSLRFHLGDPTKTGSSELILSFPAGSILTLVVWVQYSTMAFQCFGVFSLFYSTASLHTELRKGSM